MYLAFIIFRCVPCTPDLSKTFYHEGAMDFLSKVFSASNEMIMWFFSFSLFLWWITLTDFCMMNHHLHPFHPLHLCYEVQWSFSDGWGRAQPTVGSAIPGLVVKGGTSLKQHYSMASVSASASQVPDWVPVLVSFHDEQWHGMVSQINVLLPKLLLVIVFHWSHRNPN